VEVKIYTGGCNWRMHQICGKWSKGLWYAVENALWDNAYFAKKQDEYSQARFSEAAYKALKECFGIEGDLIYDATELWQRGSCQEDSTVATLSQGSVFLYFNISTVNRISIFLYLYISSMLYFILLYNY